MTPGGTASSGADPAALRLAVIGAGPRAIGALEALAAIATPGPPVACEIFDPLPHPGAGPNFSPEEVDLCLLNIPVRAIDLRAPDALRPTGGFGDWAGLGGETYPPRAALGGYLEGRFARVASGAGLFARQHADRVTRLDRAADGRWWVGTDSARHGPFDEVLLTLGQPRTAEDAQMTRWRSHARAHGLPLHPVYPARDLLEAARSWAGKTVGIRGLGLSALDAVRLLTEGLGGRFEAGRYRPSGREPARLLPFSLDGIPPFAKPASAALDARFTPTGPETARMRAVLERAMQLDPEPALAEISEALAPAARRILNEMQAGMPPEDVPTWIETERDSPGRQTTRAPVDALRHGIAMARGEVPPDAGYVIGQLWRNWQDDLRAAFNPADKSPATAARLVAFDEGLKRYSYGPPVSTAARLLTLIEAGRVDLGVAEEPEIGLTPGGWRLSTEDERSEVGAMVDSVLPSPELDRIEEPVIRQLIDAGWMQPVADGLGARTLPDGSVVGTDGAPVPGMALLGRLSLGSTVAVDSLHDCFGASTRRWAEGVAKRASARATA